MPNRVVHFEIQADNVERAAQFYRDVFDWKIEKWPGMEYWMVMTAEKDSAEPGINGGMLPRPTTTPMTECGTNSFVCTVQVDDFEATADKITKAGGKVAMPQFEIGGMALQGYFLDTEGNTFGIHQVLHSSADDAENMIEITATVHAPLSEVWEKYVGPKHIMQWNHASDDWYCPHAESDLREGGKFSSIMSSKDGKISFDFYGEFTKVDPKKEIAYAIADGRKVSVRFVPQKEGIQVVVVFEMEKQNSRDLQRSGWQSILDNFKKYVESGV